MAEGMFRRRSSSAVAVGADGADSAALFRQSHAGAHANNAVREDELLALVDQVPSLPAVINAILCRVGEDSKTSAQELENLVSQDMAIAGRILTIVNSPFYGLPNDVSNLGQAMAIIGFGSLRSLVLAASTSGILSRELPVYGIVDRGLWINAMATACLCRELTKESSTTNEPEDAFMAGLLRDIGMLVIGPVLQERSQKLDFSKDVLREERRALGFDHCWAGMRIAEKWELPRNLKFAIGRHHRVPDPCPQDRLHLLATLRIAERLAARAGLGVSEPHVFSTDIDSNLVANAGLDETGLKKVIAQLPDIIETAKMEC